MSDTNGLRQLATEAMEPLMPHHDYRAQVALDKVRRKAASALFEAAATIDILRIENERMKEALTYISSPTYTDAEDTLARVTRWANDALRGEQG